MIRIILADDHIMFRQGLSNLLAAAVDLELVGCASSGAEAIVLIRDTNPDIAIVDLSMPNGGGLEVLQKITAEQGRTRVIILTMHNAAASAAACMKAGAAGFIPKDNAFDDLLAAIKHVHAGGTFVSQQVAEAENEVDGCSSLTPKEIEVLRLIVAGQGNKAIAGRLGISIKTVETHRMRMMEKLQIHKATDLVRYAIQHGLS
jgi:DNA-binding NarL/FixJ family response regulator